MMQPFTKNRIRYLSFAVIIALLTMSLLADPEKKTTIFLAGDSTMSIKNESAYPETGWGMPFAFFWDSTVRVVNKAKNGRSTKTFIEEGLWQSIMDEIKAGDYVLIQFGHNDEAKEKTDRYTNPSQYKINLTKFVSETRKKKATPILFSPVSRRRFSPEGKALPTHEEYTELVKEVAAKEKALFIDLDLHSRELLNAWGGENSKWLFLHLAASEHPNYPDGKTDNTHFNELGARLIAQLVLKELKKLPIPLQEQIKHK